MDSNGLFEQFAVDDPKQLLHARYNLAPGHEIPVIGQGKTSRTLVAMRWGLVPRWAKDPKIGYKMINARSETLSEKPSFEESFRQRRCIIPVDGFYEWLRDGKKKQPYYFVMADRSAFALAGLWDRWLSASGERLFTFTIVTTSANERIAPYHNRMPVILDRADLSHWLDPAVTDPKTLQPLLVPYPADRMAAYAVSERVNSPGFESPDCIVPLD